MFCSRKLRPNGQVEVVEEDVVRTFYGRVPDVPPSSIDPDGDHRWFARSG